MKRQPVKSSNIASIGYNDETNILEIEFRSGGIYQYFSVPKAVHQRLMSATSIGNAFITLVRGKFAESKL